MIAKDFHVLIIGGGNCGLAIATGLKKAGIQYTVFERDSEYDFLNRPRDWGMLLHWGTEYFDKVLPPHLQDRVKEIRVDPTHEMVDPIPHFNGATGEIMQRVPAPVINRVSRKKIRKFLSEGQNLNIQCGKRLRQIQVNDDLVKAEFEDGTVATGNIIIGCDGSHSKIRSFLVGEEAAKLEEIGLTMINVPYQGYTAEQARLLRKWHPIVQLGYHYSSFGGGLLAVLDAADPDPATWKFQNYTSWWGPPFAKDLKDPTERMKYFKERLGSFCDPFRTGALAIPDGEELPIYPGQQWAPTMTWDNYGGRVTIAGDAAHSMLPHRGQGLNNAMKDASDIVDAIKKAVAGESTLKDAITAYEEEMRPRGAKEVALSLEQAEKVRNLDTVKDAPIFKLGHNRAAT